MIPLHWTETGATWYLVSPFALTAIVGTAFALGALLGRLWPRKRYQPKNPYKYVGWRA